ncbi:MAG: transcription antitermination factor NusB [Alphaproteobacteria bacterium]
MAKEPKDKQPTPRFLARLLAVQGLYLLHMNEDATPKSIVKDFKKMSLGAGENMPQLSEVDPVLLADILKGGFERQDEIRDTLEAVLTKNWSYSRLETILAAILEGGTYELLGRPDIPHPVIINEYVNIAHAFYEGKEPGFVNGILDELAKKLRK